ncbi:MAG: AfsR/SARP family transcriptional regulator, partial [Acidimicrobiia bacterium]
MRVSIRLLGGFAVDIEGTELDLAALPRRSRELVQLIALSPGHHLSRDRVIEHLFGHLGPEAAAANLHKAASLARRHLGTTTSVTIRAGLVSLWPEHTVEVDAVRFENEADAALRSGAADRCQDALCLYRGDLLPDSLSEEWAIEPRRHLRAVFVELLRAAGEWQRLIEVEPTSEEAASHLMRLSAEQGDTAGVVNRFKSLEAAMARELSLQPSSETTALYQELTRGPALVAPVAARSPLIGRNRLLSAMKEVMDTTE